MIKKVVIPVLALLIGTANAGFDTNAKSAYLVDYDSGATIVDKNADVLMPPSSMIKLMTLAVLFDEIKAGRISLDDKFPVSDNADYKNPLWYPASKICLVSGQAVSVRDLILGLIVLSGGDASVVVAEKLAGSEENFTKIMTDKARSIGMMQSTFGNASGLPNPNNLATSRELGILARHLITEHQELYPMFATKRFEFSDYQSDWCRDWGKTHTVNYNKLLFIMPGADGMKTGHTDTGGYGMVASANVGGRRLIAVINGFKAKGHDNLANEVKKLLNYGYEKTINHAFYKPGDKIVKIPTWYGRQEFVTATIAKPFVVTLDKPKKLDGVRVFAQYNGPVPAPIHAGDKVGELIATKNGEKIATADLIAIDNVKRVQFIARIMQNIKVLIGIK
ncbi:MAG: D-alanyl-D-alanine carboxypeptidase [Proteobacteria bacterium]|nr:D-alanyl-D-alanine carboxypeptidase [Candidatus Enterousia scatequi]